MKASGNMHGQLRVVQRWPFYLLPLIAALVVVEFFSGRSAGMAALIFLLLYHGYGCSTGTTASPGRSLNLPPISTGRRKRRWKNWRFLTL